MGNMRSRCAGGAEEERGVSPLLTNFSVGVLGARQSVMERTLANSGLPVLFVLDEFPVLGRMQSVESAAGLMAGFGVKLWVILQNIGQLKRHYAQSWETFVANSGVITAFGVTDQESLQVLSAKLGRLRMTEQVPTGAVGQGLLSGAASFWTCPVFVERLGVGSV